MTRTADLKRVDEGALGEGDRVLVLAVGQVERGEHVVHLAQRWREVPIEPIQHANQLLELPQVLLLLLQSLVPLDFRYPDLDGVFLRELVEVGEDSQVGEVRGGGGEFEGLGADMVGEEAFEGERREGGGGGQA